MSKLWVLVANGSNARIFSVKGRGKEIEKVHDIENPEARKKGTEIISDRPGRAFDSVGMGRHGLGKEEVTHVHELQVFAQHISELLKKGFDESAFDQVALIVSPQFLGELRRTLPDHLRKKVLKEVDKDIISSSTESNCIELMCRYLDLWNR